MKKSTKECHKNFVDYMDKIVKNKNYEGLQIKIKKDGSYSWVASAKSVIGSQRIEWVKKKAKELGFADEPGCYAKVMLFIHPYKEKPCQICGRYMSLYYHYPTSNFVSKINKKFHTNFSTNDHISFIYDELKKYNDEKSIKRFLIDISKVPLEENISKQNLVDTLEKVSREEGKKILSPVAMSNFTDRFDGFHSYNRCCRSKEDKGRSKENLKSYAKDRRAYEYWSDGNIHAADLFMGSGFFKESADHIGPISLGFIHDPRYLQPMSVSENSSKRDKLQTEDIDKIIEIENRTKVYPMSWYSKDIWEFIKNNYLINKNAIYKQKVILELYKNALKQNVSNFMYVLGVIKTSCKDQGESFLEKTFLNKNFNSFMYKYTFNERGDILSVQKRHHTERNKDEFKRYKRIAFKSIDDYNQKKNRNLASDLTNQEQKMLDKIVCNINQDVRIIEIQNQMVELFYVIQHRIIQKTQQLINSKLKN